MKMITHNTIFKAAAATVCVIAWLCAPALAQAQSPDLSVIFESIPLFDEMNVAPGDTTTRTVTVTNNSSAAQTVITAADNVDNADSFGGVLNLMIDFGSDTEFSGTFSEFFDEDEVTLGILPAGDSVVLTYRASMSISAGNDYQNSTMGFDLIVGFLGGDEVPDTPTPNPQPQPTAGGGGGGTLQVEEFVITNVRVLSQDADLGTATIAWNTNQLASSQVVYGNADSAPYSLDGGAEFFGYPNGLDEEFNNTTTHQMAIAGLTAGETYRYRVASRPSTSVLRTTSFEFEFTLGAEVPGIPTPPTDTVIIDEGTPTEGGVGGGGFFTAPGGGGAEGAGGDAGSGTIGEDIEGDGPENAGISAAAAALFGLPAEFFEFLGSATCWLWIFLILAFVWLLWMGIDWFMIEDSWNARFTRAAGRATTFFLGLGLGSLGAWFLGEMCLVIPLAIGSLAALAFLLVALFGNK